MGAEKWQTHLSPSLQDRGRAFVEAFITKIGLILRGTTSAPAARFGETLQEEHVRGGAFAAADSAAAKRALAMSNASMRLYGGAQYNRAMAEFRCAAAIATALTICPCSSVQFGALHTRHANVTAQETVCTADVATSKST